MLTTCKELWRDMEETVVGNTERIVKEFVGQRGCTPAEVIRYFNERLGESSISSVSFYNWYNGEHPMGKQGASIMRIATLVYPAGDPRHEFAKKMLEGA